MQTRWLTVAILSLAGWPFADTLWVNPAPLADSIAALSRTAPLICAAEPASAASSEEIGTFTIKRRDTIVVMCKPFPAFALANAINAAACKPNKAPVVTLEIAQVNLQFEEIPRRASKTIRAMIDCAIIVRSPSDSAMVRKLSLQAEESKITLAARRHVEKLVRNVYLNCTRQILAAAQKYAAESPAAGN